MVSINEYKTLNIELDQVNSYIPPIIINEADNNGRHLKFTPTYEGQPVTGITSARMYYDPRPRDASSIGDYVDGTKDGDGWVFVLPPNTFTANVQGIASVSFTDEDGETYTRSMPIYVESGGTKADSQGTRIDRLVAILEQMVNDFTMTAEAETGEAGSQANVTVTKMDGGAYNLKFVIPRGDKGDTGDAATIQLGTVTTGNPGTNAKITNSGTENTAVFNFTIPRGDVGPAGVNENVPLGSTSGVVAQASDAYPVLPRKVQVHGRTIENLWPKFSRTSNGITLTCDSSGLFHISGTATAKTYMAQNFDSGEIQTNTRYTILYSGDTTGLQQGNWSVYANLYGNLLNVQSNTGVSGTSGTDGSNNANVSVGAGVSIDRYFRVMLVEGDTAPDAFVPSGVHTVEPTKLVAAGKNQWHDFLTEPFSDYGITVTPNGDGSYTINGENTRGSNVYINQRVYTSNNLVPLSTIVASCWDSQGKNITSDIADRLVVQATCFANTGHTDITTGSNPYGVVPQDYRSDRFQIVIKQGASFDNLRIYPQVEFGNKATSWESPIPKIETNLPSDISLADGDTLAIDRDGTTQILHAEGEPTVLENVTLPEPPAPTFNAYTTGGYIHPTVDVDYEKDVNLVLEALEAKIAALQVADKTN